MTNRYIKASGTIRKMQIKITMRCNNTPENYGYYQVLARVPHSWNSCIASEKIKWYIHSE
jgi:hypothetical protein